MNPSKNGNFFLFITPKMEFVRVFEGLLKLTDCFSVGKAMTRSQARMKGGFE